MVPEKRMQKSRLDGCTWYEKDQENLVRCTIGTSKTFSMWWISFKSVKLEWVKASPTWFM